MVRQDVAALDVRAEPVGEPGVRCPGLHPQTDDRVAGRHLLDGLADAGHPLDVHRPGRQEGRDDAVLRLEPRGEHLLLHLAVDAHRDLPLPPVEPRVDQRVLLRQLLQRSEQRRAVTRAARLDDRLEPR
jgi:hypothetical protein